MYIPLWLISLIIAIVITFFLMLKVDDKNFRYYLYKEEREKQRKELKEFRKNPYKVLFMVLLFWAGIYFAFH
ncbi:hypothetical protein EB821_05895 [Candidatus Marinimicrobia bacterium PRS2]|nr:hypothetical protein EB821_05895 [Candidatus Marinimicrobia bacterium PRS2]